MKVIHLSAECYPVAKVGGLGDVAGALPKYLNQAGMEASVVMPFYERRFVQENEFDTIFQANTFLGNRPFFFEILKERTKKLGFDLYILKIPGLLDRTEVYGYEDDTESGIFTFDTMVLTLSQLEFTLSWLIKPEAF